MYEGVMDNTLRIPMLRAVLCTAHVPAHYTKDEMFRHLKSSCGEARATAAAVVVVA